MPVSAADVKKLREETDAPMMECKAALEEADGDMERARQILREKGKAAAAKRAERTTAAGVVAMALSEDRKTLGAIVIESETDFVAKNADFVATAQQIAEIVRDTGKGPDDPEIKAIVEAAVAKIRENIVLRKAIQIVNDAPIATYVHFDNSKGTAIVPSADGGDAVRQVAVHATAFPPEVVSKDELSKEKLDAEYEIEFQRALNEGKPENIAANIAKGRIEKDFVKRAVLLEQPFYLDPAKTVSQYLAENAKGVTIKQFVYLAVGQS
ncbi:MAG: translation elongation factor Ts [Fimbriimonadaceae bacterium]